MMTVWVATMLPSYPSSVAIEYFIPLLPPLISYLLVIHIYQLFRFISHLSIFDSLCLTNLHLSSFIAVFSLS